MRQTYDHPHTHHFDSDQFHLPGSAITSTVFACRCGAIAAIGEGKPGLIWQPWSDDEVRQRTQRVA